MAEVCAAVEAYLEVLELGYSEVKFAFESLADKNVWKRPETGLLSVGELAGHIAYWEASRLAGEDSDQPQPDPAKCRVTSPLIDRQFGYYPDTLVALPTEQHLAMTAEQVCRELLRVHKEAVADFRVLNPDWKSRVPGWPPEWTYGELVKYLAFHVSYHAGQMFSVRHLLGEQTPDN